jgi:protein SMG9
MHDFKSSSFVRENTRNNPDEHSSSMVHDTHINSNPLNLFAIPLKKEEDNPRAQHESYISALRKLRDQVAFSVSMHAPHASTYTLK